MKKKIMSLSCLMAAAALAGCSAAALQRHRRKPQPRKLRR